MKELDFTSNGFFKKLERFISERTRDIAVEEAVRAILADVRTRGDAAVLEYTHRFDGLELKAKQLRVDAAEMAAAARAFSPAQRRSIREAINCVRAFHKEGLPRSWMGRNPHGARYGERWYPIGRVGIYIPAGSVPLVSTVVMTTTLARLAGVPEIAVFTPPNREDGKISAQMRAVLHLCGITEVYSIGGAQAIGAMAYGTRTIPAVCKVMGPGNAYVAEAQRQVFGDVGVDLLPGPSEALAIADASANPRYLAADLLAQAEHGTGKEKIYYVFTDPAQAAAVQTEMAAQLPALSHRAAIERVLAGNTLFIRVPDLEAAAAVANFIAPEHLELHVEKTAIKKLVETIRTAGAILCGHDTPTVVGDFTAGPSHTLPTNRTGRYFSGLKITDFLRRSSIVEYDRRALARARPVVEAFAALESLDAHNRSLTIRFDP
ncbi:MAG: histidinol dehydrogenase [Opitutales bacterium]|nr:histidinol dehydrogenase [Opitutales bacterium]